MSFERLMYVEFTLCVQGECGLSVLDWMLKFAVQTVFYLKEPNFPDSVYVFITIWC